MRVGLPEAIGLLRKWAFEQTVLEVEFSFARFAAAMRGRIFAVLEGEVRLVSDDDFSELTLRFIPDLELHYTDPRDFEEEAGRYEGALVFIFPSSSPEEQRDHIAFMEPKTG